MSQSTFSKTPSVKIFDNRSQVIREVSYCRHPESTDITDEYITRHRFGPRGFLMQSADPRLFAKNLENIRYVNDLAGNVLHMEGADNGASVVLNDAADRPALKVNAAGITTIFQYEPGHLPGRLIFITERDLQGVTHITERFIYAGITQVEQDHNYAGSCICHYDSSGMNQVNSIALTGVPLSTTRYLLKEADNPDVFADWQSEDASVLQEQLSTEFWTTFMRVDATGALLTTCDASGNIQRHAFNIAGLLKASWLTINGCSEQHIIESIEYSAAGQKLCEVHGNGVVTTYAYEPETQRLVGIKTERPEGHLAGAKVLRDLRYEYDPVGNVLSVNNATDETRFWRNQKSCLKVIMFTTASTDWSVLQDVRWLI